MRILIRLCNVRDIIISENDDDSHYFFRTLCSKSKYQFFKAILIIATRFLKKFIKKHQFIYNLNLIKVYISKKFSRIIYFFEIIVYFLILLKNQKENVKLQKRRWKKIFSYYVLSKDSFDLLNVVLLNDLCRPNPNLRCY